MSQGTFQGWREESERLEKEGKKVRTCVPYTDKSGKERYKGTDKLRATELLDCTLASFFHVSREYPISFGQKLVELWNDLTREACGACKLPPKVPSARESFKAMPLKTMDLDLAKLHEVFDYLRQCKHLVIPPHWEELVPKAGTTSP